MKKLLIIAVAIYACACRPNPIVEQVLVQADSLMLSQPDSALLLLEGVSPDDPSGAQQQAYYALLLSQAYAKNYAPIANDSLIRIAHHFYSGPQKRDVKKRALANYYLGLVQVNIGEFENATSSFLDAVRYGQQVNDQYLLGLAHTQLGLLYENQNLFPQAIEHYQESYDVYSSINMPRHALYSLIKVADALILVKNHADALEHYQRAAILAEENQDALSSIRIGKKISSIFLHQLNNPKEAQNILLGTYEKYNDGNVPKRCSDHFVLGSIHFRLGDLDRARRYFNLALLDDDVERINVAAIESELYELEESAGNHARALVHLKKHYDLVDSLFYADQQQSVLEIEKKYDTSQLEYANYRHRTRQRYIVAGCIILIVGMAFLYRRYRINIAKRDSEIRNNLIALSEVNNSLNSILSSKNEKEQKLKAILGKRLDVISKYYDLAYSWQMRPDKRSKKMEELLSLESIEGETFPILQAIIEERHGGLLKALKEVHPTLSEKDINFLCLIMCGISSQQMCAIYGIQDPQSVYTKKYRLSEKLRLPQGEKIELYLMRFAENRQ